MKTTSEVNETTETLKKLAINNSADETEVAKTEQQINGNGNEIASSCNGENAPSDQSSSTSS